jgi:hypothetical protein
MTATQIKKELNAYLPLLSNRQQEILLDMVKNLLNIDKKEKRISVEQYNKEIEASMKQINEGKFVTHAEVLKQSKKWFKRK